MIAMSKCPMCEKEAKPRAENEAFPFCSARCKQVDLYHWLHEDYRVPVIESNDDPGEATEHEKES
jgi:hypothetical protein